MNYFNFELEIIENIENYDLLDLLKNNILSFDFVKNYILNEKYQKSRKEKNITVSTICLYQPQLEKQFIEIIKNHNIV